MILLADSEGPDQTVQVHELISPDQTAGVHRLIWAFAARNAQRQVSHFEDHM